MSCCTNSCTLGRNCPIRAFHDAQLPATELITVNSDGSCPHQTCKAKRGNFEDRIQTQVSWVRVVLAVYVLIVLVTLAVFFFRH